MPMIMYNGINNEREKMNESEMNDIIGIYNIDETIEMLYAMIDGKCCSKQFIDDVVKAIDSLKKVRVYM